MMGIHGKTESKQVRRKYPCFQSPSQGRMSSDNFWKPSHWMSQWKGLASSSASTLPPQAAPQFGISQGWEGLWRASDIGKWKEKKEGTDTKTCVLKYGRVTLPWELWCLHPGNEINGIVLLGLVMITNTARYCILASRNQTLATTHQADITLLSWSSNHDSLSALVFLSNFVQKLLLRNCPCVLWYNFFSLVEM